MSTNQITIKELIYMSAKYINSQTTNDQIAILEKIWVSGGRKAAIIFAEKISIAPNELINWINDYYYSKRMWRYRGRKIIITDPPAPKITDYNDEAAEIAEMVAGGHGGEQRYSRRNTLTSTTKNRARKF